MKRILFVDDEPLVLEALQRSLYGMRGEWQMLFADSGAAALEAMAEKPADVIISDMRMPNMNGAELLCELMQRYPKTLRIIFPDYADEDMVMQCMGGTHQYLSKPCTRETLRSVIQRTLEMDQWLNNDQVKTLVSGMTRVPSLPALYFQILKELRSSEAAVERVGNTIGQDPGMTAKMLQIVNSAFFGLGRRLTDPTDAVMQLGLETVKSLVLTIHVFSGFESEESTKLQAEKIYRHSLATAFLARQISQFERQDHKMAEECFTAGLLHDIGRLALIANAPEQYAAAVRLSREEPMPLVEAERAVFGTSHAEVGGYLLALWGLPVTIVEAAMFHHHPGKRLPSGFSSLTAVHVANVFEHAQNDETSYRFSGLRSMKSIWPRRESPNGCPCGGERLASSRPREFYKRINEGFLIFRRYRL